MYFINTFHGILFGSVVFLLISSSIALFTLGCSNPPQTQHVVDGATVPMLCRHQVAC